MTRSPGSKLSINCPYQHLVAAERIVPWVVAAKAVRDRSGIDIERVTTASDKDSQRPTYVIDRIICSSELALADSLSHFGVRSTILYPAGQIWCSEM
jgi:hypothetical protein